jgi:hypothetical protein
MSVAVSAEQTDMNKHWTLKELVFKWGAIVDKM